MDVRDEDDVWGKGHHRDDCSQLFVECYVKVDVVH